MVGTQIDVTAKSGPPSSTAHPEVCLFLAGLAERGPTLASPDAAGKTYTELTSLADFTRQNGDPQPYSQVWPAVKVHLEEAAAVGALIRLVRLVGVDATAGSSTLVDRAGTPQPTVKIEAANEGAWSTRLSWQVAAGQVANTIDLTILFDGQVAEVFPGLGSPGAIADALATSTYVRGEDLGSVTAEPGNLPAVGGPTALSAGDDDRGSLVTADYLAAYDAAFPRDLGAGVVALPGFTAAEVGAGLKAHCKAVGNRNAILATGLGTTQAAAKAAAASMLGADGERLMVAWPWVSYRDGKVPHTVSPEAFVAAGRTKAIAAEGVWRMAAGDITRATFITGVEQTVTDEEGDALDDAHVSVIRMIAGRPEVYGGRSLSLDAENWDLFKHRDFVNKLVFEMRALVRDLEFGTIDGKGRYLARLGARLRGYLQPFVDVGALFPRLDDVDGHQIDPGFSVDVSPAQNPVTLLQQRKVAALVEVRPSESATGILIHLVKAALTASV